MVPIAFMSVNDCYCLEILVVGFKHRSQINACGHLILGPCPSRGALVIRVGSLSYVMQSDGSAYFVFVSSTDHLGLLDIFGHYGNVLATMSWYQISQSSLSSATIHTQIQCHRRQGKTRNWPHAAHFWLLWQHFGFNGNRYLRVPHSILLQLSIWHINVKVAIIGL